MIQSFRHKGLEKFFRTGSTVGIRADHAKKLRLILAHLEAVSQVRELGLPGLRLHRLSGEFAGRYAVWVNANWRVTFRFLGGHAFEVDYLDYH